jgi:hypothetical protein
MYAPLIDVPVKEESTSKTFVALPTAVGRRLVEKACPDATLTRVLVFAGRSTNIGCLFELEDDTAFYVSDF